MLLEEPSSSEGERVVIAAGMWLEWCQARTGLRQVSTPKQGSPGEITGLLVAWREGRTEASDLLFPLIYDELHEVARRLLRRRRAGETLRTTALVHETYLRLVDQTRVEVGDREHFFALAARAMRHILIDHARRQNAEKRGGGAIRVTLSGNDTPVEARGAELVALDEALQELERLDPRLVRVVELRFFGGLSVEETAVALDLSDRTVKRDWRKARAFLYATIHGELGSPGP